MLEWANVFSSRTAAAVGMFRLGSFGVFRHLMAAVIALLLAVLGTAFAVPSYVPVHVTRNQDGTVAVSFQKIDMALRAADPSAFPMFNDLALYARDPGSRVMPIEELEVYLDDTLDACGEGMFHDVVDDGNASCAVNDTSLPSYAYPVPAGFVFHEARVGSTLAANSKWGFGSQFQPAVAKCSNRCPSRLSALQCCLASTAALCTVNRVRLLNYFKHALHVPRTHCTRAVAAHNVMAAC